MLPFLGGLPFGQTCTLRATIGAAGVTAAAVFDMTPRGNDAAARFRDGSSRVATYVGMSHRTRGRRSHNSHEELERAENRGRCLPVRHACQEGRVARPSFVVCASQSD